MMKSVQRGLTLLESLLTLAIASTVIVLGLSIYRSQQTQQQYSQVQYNVNILLQALGQYYLSNCYGTYDTSQNFTAGILNPSVVSSTTAPYLVNLYSGLKIGGFVSPTNLVNNISMLDNSSDTAIFQFSAYVLQLNPQATAQETMNACTTVNGVACSTVTPTTAVGHTSIFAWIPQVAIKMFIPAGTAPAKMQSLMTAYLYMFNADCISALNGTIVTPCASASASPSNNYLVFTRLPSYVSSSIQSPMWQTMPMLKQFNLQYSHDQMLELQNGSNTSATTQSYLCGG